MSVNIWLYDLAREQSPTPAQLLERCRAAGANGYDAVGFYLEHRFAYPSTPWAHSDGIVTPAMVQDVRRALPDGPRLIPFLNVLGHTEGFVRTRGGAHLAEGPARFSASICPSHPSASQFARMLIADALEVFDDEWVHIGGDETWQLGQCPLCSVRADRIGKDGLYAEHLGPLCHWLVERGRRPCLWGDMLLQHPHALDALPRETILFDWQYDKAPEETSRVFRERGFDVVCSPAVKSYHAPFLFLDQTRENIDAHRRDAERLGALGVCVTSWEFFGLSEYRSLLPVIYACGQRLAHGTDWDEALRKNSDPAYLAAAEILGVTIPNASEVLRRTGLDRFRFLFLLGQDPFALWRAWRGEVRSEIGATIAAELARVDELLPSDHLLRRGWLVLDVALRWVQQVERACQEYTENPAASRAALQAGHEQLARLMPLAREIADEGGSAVDASRVARILDRVAAVIGHCPDERGMRRAQPAFDELLRGDYVPGDQAGWGFAGPRP